MTADRNISTLMEESCRLALRLSPCRCCADCVIKLDFQDDRLFFFRYNKEVFFHWERNRGGVVMEPILEVSGSEQGHTVLQQLLQEMELSDIQHASTGLEARNMLAEQQFQLVLVNTPLPDEHGEAVGRLAFSKNAQVLLLVKPEHVDAVWERICKTGIYLIAKPLKRSVFFQTLQCIILQEQRVQSLQAEKEKLQRSIQEINLVNRAKLVLIQVLKLSEPQAHRYIEKQAMDLRMSKREVAEGIINTYEN